VLVGRRATINEPHLDNCSFQLKNCKWNCGWSGLEPSEHEDECVHAQIPCSKCEELVLKTELQVHQQECIPEKDECSLCGLLVLSVDWNNTMQFVPNQLCLVNNLNLGALGLERE